MNIREAVAIAIMEADHGRKGHAAITAFLDAAAEQGWQMRRDEATGAMLEAGMGDDGPHWPEPCWRAMCAASPKFELEE